MPLPTLVPLPALVLLVLIARAPALPVGPGQATQSADEQYRFLAGLVEKGLHELAVEQAQDFLRAHPEHDKANLARYRLAGALWELERRDEAAREYDTLGRIEDFEYRAECLFRCGEAAVARGDEARARAAFEGVLAAGQDYLVAPALFALAETHFRARRFEPAEQRYGELLRKRPDAAEAPLARRALAWAAWERGDTAETARRARAFLKDERDPARADELRLLLGEALLASDPQSALEAFRALQTKEQLDARMRGEGFALAALGDHAGAARAFDALLERSPDGRHAGEAALQSGIEHLRAGDARAGVQRLRKAAAGGEPETLYWLAQAEKQGGEPAAALATLEKALRRKPAAELEERIHVLRGDCLAAVGRASEALGAYEKSGSARALQAGAVTALNQGDTAGAARLAERLLRTDADGPAAQSARVVLAEASFSAKRYPEAERALEDALKNSSEPAEEARLRSRLAWCRYLAGDLAEGRTRFAALVQRHPDAPEAEEALAMTARIALEQDDAAAARAPASQYLERYPRGRFADQALLGLARSSTGKEARQRYEDWLTRFPESELRPGVLLELAELLSTSGAHSDAARRYAEAAALAPGTGTAARAAYGVAWCAWEGRDFAACAEALVPLARDAKTEPALRRAALELLISAQLEEQEFEASVATWRQLATMKGEEPRRWESARRILAALRREQRFDEGAALLAECARSLSERALVAEVELEAAYLALEQKDTATAEAALARARKAGASAAGLAEASFHVGEAALAAGNAPRAVAFFQESAAVAQPRAADALYKLAFVRLGAGELEPAAEALRTLLEQHPESELADEARFLAGECAFRARRFDEAARLFAGAREHARGDLLAKTLFRAGLSLGELGRWSECDAALSELARSFPQFPNLAEGELWRGRALAAQQKSRAARAAFERTLALDQGELAAQARLGLGALLEAEGRLDDALSEYLKVALLYAHEDAVAEALFASGRVLEAQQDGARAAARYRELCDQHPRSRFAAPARERLRALGGVAGNGAGD